MKTLEELKTVPKLCIQETAPDGGRGFIQLSKTTASVIWSNGGSWEHVSIAPYKRSYIPSWEDMCKLKDMFFHDNEWVVQFHPAKSEYVNNMPNCLHLWRPVNETMPTPPSWMTGIKRGESMSDILKAAAPVIGANAT